MKKILIFGIIILSLLIAGCKVQEKEPVKVGAIYQETGTGSDWGARAIKGVNLAAEKINADGGIDGRKLAVIYEDSKSTPKDAVTAISKLIDVDGVKAVLSQQSSVVMALSPIANENKIILVDTGATTPSYTSADDFTFRVSYTATYFAKEISSMLNKKEIKTLGMLYVNNDYGQGMLKTYREYFNGDIIISETFADSAADFRTQLQKIKEKNPDAVVFASNPTQAGIILKQREELGLTQQFYTDANAMEYQSALDSAGGAAEGVIYASQFYDVNRTDDSFRDFNSRFMQKYNESSNPLSAQAYDGLMVLAAAMRKCENPADSECIKDGLYNISIKGIIGSITFDRYGDVIYRPTIIKTVKNNTFVQYK